MKDPEFDRLIKDKQKAHRGNNLKEVARFCNLIGELLARHGEYEEAIEQHTEELNLSEAYQDGIGSAVANRKIGECYMSMGQYAKALKYQKMHLQLAQSLEDDVEVQRAYATIGRTFLSQADLGQDPGTSAHAAKQAEAAFKNSLGVCDKLKSQIPSAELMEMKARLYLNLGLVYDNFENVKQSAQFIRTAIQIAERYNLSEDLFRCQFSLGGIYQRHGKLGEALRCMETAVKCAKKSKDKYAESDAMFQKGLIFTQLGDYSASKKQLKKAYKLGAPTSEKKTKYEKVLKAVVKLENCKEKLESVQSLTSLEKMKLCEKLGDNAAFIEIYKQALEFYHEMLNQAETAGLEGKGLIPVYVSLAQTYMDTKQYKKAEYYYRKEMECMPGDHNQVARSWMNIADAQEHAGEGYSVIKKSYQYAMENAKKAKLPKLQVLVLKSLIVTQSQHHDDEGKSQSEEMVANITSKFDLDSEANSCDEEDEPEEDVESDVDIDDISDSDDSCADEEYDRGGGRSRRGKVTRNDKGETPLHRACIAGKLSKVKELVKKMPQLMNIRDYCGWLPLHEAANHDYVDIVEYLVDHGAHINDRGGDKCGGITPLHDACACGNLEVVQVLVKKGANVHAKDDEGNTGLDTLKAYRHRSTDILNRQELSSLREVEKLIHHTMKGNNPHLSRRQSVVSQVPTHDSQYDDSDAEQTDSEQEELPDIISRTKPNQKRGEKTSALARHRRNLHRSPSPSNMEESECSSRAVIESSQDTPMSDEENPYHTGLSLEDIERLHNPNTAPSAYKDAISSLGSATRHAVHTHDVTLPTPTQDSHTPALIDADQDVGESWLIDDIGNKATKRKLGDVDTVFRNTGLQHKRQRKSDENLGSSVSQATQRRKTKAIAIESESDSEPDDQINFIQMEDSDRNVIDMNIDNNPSSENVVYPAVMGGAAQGFDLQDFDLTESQDIHLPRSLPPLNPVQPNNIFGNTSTQRSKLSLSQKGKKSHQTKLTAFGMSYATKNTETTRHNSVHSQGTTIPQSAQPVQRRVVMRLRVAIKDKVILVPVPESTEEQTMSWLCQQAADRYYQLYNLRPVLSLATRDGAMFSPDDLVAMLLSNDEEVIGQVERWDLLPLATRYVDACKSLKSTMYRNVKTMLHTADSSGSLCLANLALRPIHFHPIARAIQCQTALRELRLQGNKLGDDGMKFLVDSLPSLPGVTVLDLSVNGIGPVGMKTLADKLAIGNSSENLLQGLEVLNLGYNSIGDSSTQSIVTCLQRLPALKTLALTSCDLTMMFFQQLRVPLGEALQASVLQHLDMSYNNLSSTGVELLLKCLENSSLISLNLTSTVQSYTANHTARHVYRHLIGSSCMLQSLWLDDCHLASQDSEKIRRFISESKTLRNISLSMNTKLSKQDITDILESAATGGKLISLSCIGCSVEGPIDTEFLDALNSKLCSDTPLRRLEFTCRNLCKLDCDSVSFIWRTCWAEMSNIQMTGNKVMLSINDNTI